MDAETNINSGLPYNLRTRKHRIKLSSNGTDSSGGLRNQLFIQASHMKSNINHRKKRNIIFQYNYTNIATVLLLPILTILYLTKFSTTILPLDHRILVFTFIYYNFTILAFISGYHKCYTHNSFRSRSVLLHYYFAVFGSSLGLGSIKWWSTLHKAHHQFTDNTEKDPYLIKRGFFWAHTGWLLARFKHHVLSEAENNHTERVAKETLDGVSNEALFEDDELDDDKDSLDENYDDYCKQLMNWQEKYYLLLFIITTVAIPTAVTVYYLKDTFLNGLIYPGILRMFMCQQSILSTESICHMGYFSLSIPSQPFSDKNSSQNCSNPLVSILTYGQAEQNFHHEFPHDYRNSPSSYSFDPTKWFIWVLHKFSFVDQLCVTPKALVMQLQIQQQQEIINRMKSRLIWGTPISRLPLIKPRDFKKIIASASQTGRIYIIIQNVIHDITPFMEQHPGGVQLLKASHGKDATKAFFGGVYGHLTAATNLLATMRIGLLDVGNDEEVWRRMVKEEGDMDDSNSRRENGSYKTAEAA